MIAAWDHLLCEVKFEVAQPPRAVGHYSNRQDYALSLST